MYNLVILSCHFFKKHMFTLGVAPPSFIFLQAGTTLQQITKEGIKFSWNSILMITLCAITALVPIIYQQYTKRTTLKRKVL